MDNVTLKRTAGRNQWAELDPSSTYGTPGHPHPTSGYAENHPTFCFPVTGRFYKITRSDKVSPSSLINALRMWSTSQAVSIPLFCRPTAVFCGLVTKRSAEEQHGASIHRSLQYHQDQRHNYQHECQWLL